MTSFVFLDTTVLCNFAAVRRLDLLAAVLLGRGRWTEAVRYEAQRAERALPAVHTVVTDGWLGEPVVVDQSADVDFV